MEEKFMKVLEKFKEVTQKECYRIEVIEEEPSILDDKIGGRPYLPIGEEYPKDNNGDFLALLLQVNLKNIDLDGYPDSGILEIFTDKNVNYPCEYAVRYFSEGLEYQENLPDVDLSNYIVKEAQKIELKKDFCHMSFNDYRFASIMCPIANEIYEANTQCYGDLEDLWEDFEWYDLFTDEISDIRITFGGYPDFTQSDPRFDFKENMDECLFKLDSSADYDKFEIGDSGILFALISKENIEKVNFDKAIVDWDCC